MRLTHGLVLVVSLLVVGCHSGRSHYVAPQPTPVANIPVYGIDVGAPTVVDATYPGFGIAANVGGSYRVVWTGNSGGFSRFQGYIYSQSGFSSVDAGCVDDSCRLESDDYMAVVNYAGGGQYIEFDTLAATSFDGVDFVTPADPVEFDFYIDGQQFTTSVYFTSSGIVANTEVFPFALVQQ